MLANPARMQGYTGNQFGERTVTDLESILDDPTSLLFMASPHARQHNSSATGTGNLDILSASQYPHPSLDRSRRYSSKRKPAIAPSASHQLYGGIVLDDRHADPSKSSDQSSDLPESPRPKKKAKKAVDPGDSGHEDSSKKSRGRPRVDTQDETAADRRRTQIRLAQRAYRHRKETTITGLKQQVSGLQATIEQMNSAFLALHDNLMDSGAMSGHGALSTHLKSVMDQFDQLATDATVEEDDDINSPPTKAVSKQKPKPSKAGGTAAVLNTSPYRSVGDLDSDADELPLTTMENANDPLYAYDDASWNDANTDVMQFHVHLPEAQVDLEAITQSNSLHLETKTNVPHSLSSSVPSSGGFYTYSFQETTFGRRLQRLCLERAFRHLTSPSTSPSYITRTFRFTFCFSNRQRMLSRFQAMLKRKAGEALENFDVPFFQIGGAGTHFPRRDQHGRIVMPPNMHGPERAVNAPGFNVSSEAWSMRRRTVDTPRSERSVQDLLEHLGYGGLWLDSHDVDEYLKAKGIFLDGTSSFIEVDPQVLMLDMELPTNEASPSTMNSSPLRTPSPLGPPATINLLYPVEQPFTQQSPDDMFSSFLDTTNNSDLAVREHMASFEKDLRSLPSAQQVTHVQSAQVWPWTEPAPAFSASNGLYNYDTDTTTTPDYTTTGNMRAPYNTSNDLDRTAATEGVQGARTVVDRLLQHGAPVTIDVERLLERLVDGGACLGRAPGFRKELVDHAVVMSLAEAF